MRHEVQKAAYTFGNLLRNTKKDVAALFDIDYYQGGGIDFRGDDNDYFLMLIMVMMIIIKNE